MRVGELVTRKVPPTITVEPAADVVAAARLLAEHGIGGLPVVDATGAVRGFVAERDIVQSIVAGRNGPDRLRVDEIMRRPAPTCSVSDPLQDVMTRMTRQRLRHLVVMDGDRIAGVISVGDIVKHRLEQLETETGVLRDYVAAHRAVT